jgi:rhodanese-related sulfurtransferase
MKLFMIIVAAIVISITGVSCLNKKSFEKYFALGPDQAIVVDVRTAQEYNAGHYSTAINIPHLEIGNHLAELEPFKQKPVILYCHSGNRASIAAKVLKQNGFINVINAGGYEGIKKFDKK